MEKPYVVSADICLLMKEWAVREAFVLPSKEFFDQLREDFSRHMRGFFSNFEFVSENEIANGLSDLVANSCLPILSLDRAYCKSELNFEIARLVDKYGRDRGLGHRAGTSSLWQQIKKLQINGVDEVAIVDDVLFSGALLERVIDLLSRVGIQVPLICVGIGIGDGIERISSAKREVLCVRSYNQVIDEVCERDFYPGVPLSGRLLIGNDNIGVPYILPFGNPRDWASIPSEHTAIFSKFCLHQTISLFDEIERCSGKSVLCQDLERKVIGLPIDDTSYTDVLRKIL
jgi:hypothetical protein